MEDHYLKVLYRALLPDHKWEDLSDEGRKRFAEFVEKMDRLWNRPNPNELAA